MRDAELRQAMVKFVSASAAASAILVPEVDIRWTIPARMDALLVSNRVCGYEIKSDHDSLARLPRQVEAYSSVVERAVLLVTTKHLARAQLIVPDWWNIWVATKRNDAVRIRKYRSGRLNPSLEPLALTSFMRRTDIVQCLRRSGALGLSRRTIDDLRLDLVREFDAKRVISLARTAMLGRPDWRFRSILAS